MERFGNFSQSEVHKAIENARPTNTVKSDKFVWRQFMEFCTARGYKFEKLTPTEELAKMLQDWAYNMRKSDGTDYKEGTLKLIWNKTAKMLQEIYFTQYNRKINPFCDMVFQSAVNARNAKRKELQSISSFRKISAVALTRPEIEKMAASQDEDTPDGLQRKFFHIAASELAWRGNEAVFCLTDYFHEEKQNDGSSTGRIEYNPIFTKTTQGGAHKTAESKWLVRNIGNPDLCPVRLFTKLMSKRGDSIKTKRIFLTINKNWNQNPYSAWYKNCPMGINEIRKWTKIGAEKIGLDIKGKKITNHSNRAAAVSSLTNSGANLQEVIKMTGHSSISSITPYLQLNEQHHMKIVSGLRTGQMSDVRCSPQRATCIKTSELTPRGNYYYNNCNFTINNNCSCSK